MAAGLCQGHTFVRGAIAERRPMPHVPISKPEPKGPDSSPYHRPNIGFTRSVKLVFSIAALLFPAVAFGNEVCEYAGQTDYSGLASVRAEIWTARNETEILVTLRFTATVWIIFKVEYLAEETSRWRNDELRSVALNTRYLVNGRIIRQQWDYFDREKDGFAAYRVQGKNGDDFRRRYPAFSRHWSPSTFGQPWLQEYSSAHPERRPDLDLQDQAIPPGLRPPLAFAFYWIRSLRPFAQTVPLFLPGNKRQPRLDLSLPPPQREPGQRQLWHVSVRLESLSVHPESN